MKTLGKNFKLGFIANSTLRVGDGDDGGDGGNQTPINETPEFKEALANATKAAIEEATSGLSKKNQELLDELKNAKGNLKQFEGIDIDSVKNMMNQINQSEEMKLISEGKFDEVLKKRMDSVNAKHQEEVSTLNKQLEEALSNSNKYKATLETNTISDKVRNEALKAGVLPEALDDIVRRGLDLFSINDSGEIEARDANGQLLMHDDLLVTPERFVLSLKKTSKHYWGASAGSDAEGNDGSNRQSQGQDGSSLADLASSNNGNFDLEAYRRKRKQISGDNYHKKR